MFASTKKKEHSGGETVRSNMSSVVVFAKAEGKEQEEKEERKGVAASATETKMEDIRPQITPRESMLVHHRPFQRDMKEIGFEEMPADETSRTTMGIRHLYRHDESGVLLSMVCGPPYASAYWYEHEFFSYPLNTIRHQLCMKGESTKSWQSSIVPQSYEIALFREELTTTELLRDMKTHGHQTYAEILQRATQAIVPRSSTTAA